MRHPEIRKQRRVGRSPPPSYPVLSRRARLVVADRQAVAASTQALVGGVVHRLTDEVNAAVAEDKLATLRVTRPEAMPQVPVALGHAVRHAGNAVVGITLVGRFLLAPRAEGHEVNAGRSAGEATAAANKPPPTAIPVVRALAENL